MTALSLVFDVRESVALGKASNVLLYIVQCLNCLQPINLRTK